MRKLFLCLFILVFTYGCSHKLQALIDISGEKAEQASYVKAQNTKLELLFRDVKERNLKIGLTENEVIRYYGNPVLVKREDGLDVFLYRNTVEFFPKEKVYLFFDSDGKLMGSSLEQKETKPAPEVINPE